MKKILLFAQLIVINVINAQPDLTFFDTDLVPSIKIKVDDKRLEIIGEVKSICWSSSFMPGTDDSVFTIDYLEFNESGLCTVYEKSEKLNNVNSGSLVTTLWKNKYFYENSELNKILGFSEDRLDYSNEFIFNEKGLLTNKIERVSLTESTNNIEEFLKGPIYSLMTYEYNDKNQLILIKTCKNYYSQSINAQNKLVQNLDSNRCDIRQTNTYYNNGIVKDILLVGKNINYSIDHNNDLIIVTNSGRNPESIINLFKSFSNDSSENSLFDKSLTIKIQNDKNETIILNYKKGNLVKSIYFDDKGSMRFVLFYANINGTTKLIRKESSQGKLLLKNEYDKFGNLVCQKDINSGNLYAYQYKYDNQGNWTERKISSLPNKKDKGKLISIEKRSFEYWP